MLSSSSQNSALTHERIWAAIDALAKKFSYSPSGLAKKAGMDSTTFNKSKRTGPEGKPRWPSTESISRILAATGATLPDFLALIENPDSADLPGESAPGRPFNLRLAELGRPDLGALFDPGGLPVGDKWDRFAFPDMDIAGMGTDSMGTGSMSMSGMEMNRRLFALEAGDESLAPLCRRGAVLIAATGVPCRSGDRVVCHTQDGAFRVMTLAEQKSGRVKLAPLNPDYEQRVLPEGDIAWMARILWVSQ